MAGKAAMRWDRIWKSGGGGPAATGGSSRKRKAPPPPPAKQQQQMYLDFGQRSFGRQIECAVCGMLYTEGEPEDEKEHQRRHQRAVRGVVMPAVADERVVRPDRPPIACQQPPGQLPSVRVALAPPARPLRPTAAART